VIKLGLFASLLGVDRGELVLLLLLRSGGRVRFLCFFAAISASHILRPSGLCSEKPGHSAVPYLA
jgi:hypothetical protein